VADTESRWAWCPGVPSGTIDTQDADADALAELLAEER
jgi:hypothetical protein